MNANVNVNETANANVAVNEVWRCRGALLACAIALA